MSARKNKKKTKPVQLSKDSLKYEPSYVTFTKSRYKIFETAHPFSEYEKTYITASGSKPPLPAKPPSERKLKLVPSKVDFRDFPSATILFRDHSKAVRVQEVKKKKHEYSDVYKLRWRPDAAEINREVTIKKLLANQPKKKVVPCTCEGESLA
jgi:hypothetical protein